MIGPRTDRSIEVQYHSDGSEPARPAVNVKVHAPGQAFWSNALDCLDDEGELFTNRASESLRSDFWQDAQELAERLGLGDIATAGRSGGWLVFTDGRDPEDMDDAADCIAAQYGHKCGTLHDGREEWLDAYSRFAEWCDERVRTAPERVAALAQQYAMDAAGEQAAERMFAFGRELTLAEYRANGGETFYAGGQPF